MEGSIVPGLVNRVSAGVDFAPGDPDATVFRSLL